MPESGDAPFTKDEMIDEIRSAIIEWASGRTTADEAIHKIHRITMKRTN